MSSRHTRSIYSSHAVWLILFTVSLVACQATAASSDLPATSTAASAQETLTATATKPVATETPTARPTLFPTFTATSPPPTHTATPTPTPDPPTPTATPSPTPDLGRVYEMTYEIEHPTVLGQQTLVDLLWLPLPNGYGDGTRDVHVLDIYPDGYQILDIGEENQAIFWENVPDLCQQTNCRFGARFRVTLQQPVYAIPWAQNPTYDTSSDLFVANTQPQRGIESDDPQIRELANTIIGAETNVYKKVLLIQSWVQQNVRYAELGSTYPDDAILCIEQGVGDCAGQSKVFVALCRAAGIPARSVAGVLPFERGVGMGQAFACEQAGCRATWPWFGDADSPARLSVHVWVEVYLPPLGWVQAEPDMPGFGIDKERLITQRGLFAFPRGLCGHATYFHLPIAVQGNWCGQSVGWQVSVDAQVIE